MNTEEILNDMSMTLQWSENTRETYSITLRQYAKYHNLDLQQLLDEADEEEDKRIRMKHRQIKTRLLSFQQYMAGKYEQSTTNKKMALVKHMYSFYEIELPRIIPIKVIKTETIKDIPTAEHIRTAILSTPNKKSKAIIALMASSGMGRSEILHLTLQDFIDATQDYTSQTELVPILNELSTKSVVPTFNIHRIKTGMPYYTFCTPEATQLIIDYILERMFREDLTLDKQLIDISKYGFVKMFSRINDKQGWGYKNKRRFFRSHSMRKFFATTLTKARVDFIYIEFLLGHSINSTTAAYYKVDPESLKKRYMTFMDKLTFLGDIKYDTIQSQEKQELELLRAKTKEQEERINAIEQILQQRHI